MRRSRLLDEQNQPKDDIVNWLFLKSGKYRFSFVYKMEKPLESKYEIPFRAKLAFTFIEGVIKFIKLNHDYEVWRGEEIVGTVRLIRAVE
mgnify:CR=1 FL=1